LHYLEALSRALGQSEGPASGIQRGSAQRAIPVVLGLAARARLGIVGTEHRRPQLLAESPAAPHTRSTPRYRPRRGCLNRLGPRARPPKREFHAKNRHFIGQYAPRSSEGSCAKRMTRWASRQSVIASPKTWCARAADRLRAHSLPKRLGLELHLPEPYSSGWSKAPRRRNESLRPHLLLRSCAQERASIPHARPRRPGRRYGLLQLIATTSAHRRAAARNRIEFSMSTPNGNVRYGAPTSLAQRLLRGNLALSRPA